MVEIFFAFIVLLKFYTSFSAGSSVFSDVSQISRDQQDLCSLKVAIAFCEKRSELKNTIFIKIPRSHLKISLCPESILMWFPSSLLETFFLESSLMEFQWYIPKPASS